MTPSHQSMAHKVAKKKEGESRSSQRGIGAPGFSWFKSERAGGEDRPGPLQRLNEYQKSRPLESTAEEPFLRGIRLWIILSKLKRQVQDVTVSHYHPRPLSLRTIVTQTDISYVVPPTPVTFFTPPTGLVVVWLAKAGREMDLIGCSVRGEGSRRGGQRERTKRDGDEKFGLYIHKNIQTENFSPPNTLEYIWQLKCLAKVFKPLDNHELQCILLRF